MRSNRAVAPGSRDNLEDSHRWGSKPASFPPGQRPYFQAGVTFARSYISAGSVDQEDKAGDLAGTRLVDAPPHSMRRGAAVRVWFAQCLVPPIADIAQTPGGGQVLSDGGGQQSLRTADAELVLVVKILRDHVGWRIVRDV